MELAQRTKVTKGRLGKLRFMYNPANFVDTIGVTYNEFRTAGISYPLLTYGGGETRTVTFDLYLNDKVKPGVTEQTIAYLHSFLPKARRGPEYQFQAPPEIVFAYGWFVKDCLLRRADIDYRQMSPDLRPISAIVSIELILIQ